MEATLNVRITDSIKDKLKILATERQETTSTFIRKLIVKELKNKEKLPISKK